jgi:hypothetical protein
VRFGSGHSRQHCALKLRDVVQAAAALLSRRKSGFPLGPIVVKLVAREQTVEIAEWLRSLGLGQYAPAFAENAIHWDVLPKLTADDLDLIHHKRMRIVRSRYEELLASSNLLEVLARSEWQHEYFPPLVAVTSGKNETISFGIKELIETFQIGFLGWVPFYNSAARLFCDPLSRKATSSATQGVGTRRASGELRIDASFHQKWDPFRLGTGSFFHRYLVVEALSRLCNRRLVEATMPQAGWLRPYTRTFTRLLFALSAHP